MSQGLGFGVTGNMDAALVRQLAPEVERAGCSMFWSNDIPNGSSFDVLGACASVTRSIGLANGVVPIDRVPPERWAALMAEAGLDSSRYLAGIGSGRLQKPLGPLSAAIDRIHTDTGARVVLGALRTRMRRLAAERADGVLLNWLTPSYAAAWQAEMLGQRASAGNDAPFLPAAFVRVAIGDAAIAQLRVEADRYAAIPQYAKHFEEMGVSAFETAVAATSVDDAADALLPFLDALDHPVLRCVVAEDSPEAYAPLIEAGRLAIERFGER